MQTWETNDVPDKWKSSPESIKQHMRDWKYVLLTNKDRRNFVEKYFPDFLLTFDSFAYNIQRADAIRYMWLYIHGGLYLDLDVEIQKPLDPLFTTDNDIFVVPSENIQSQLTNCLIASKPKLKIWLDMIDHMKKPVPWWAVTKHLKVTYTTGPCALTKIIRKSDIIYALLPNSLANPCSICDLRCLQIKDSYVIPLGGGSWYSWDTKLLKLVLCSKKETIIIITIAIVIIFILMIKRKWKQ